MNAESLAPRYPVSTLVAPGFVIALAVTAAYWAGAVPGVPKTLPMFVDLVAVTGTLFVLTVLAWAASFRER